MKTKKTRDLLCVLISVLALGPAASFAADRTEGRDLTAIKPNLGDAKLEQPVTRQGITLQRAKTSVLDPSLIGATGTQQVIIRLSADAVAKLQDTLPSSQSNQRTLLQQKQSEFMVRCDAIAPNARLLGQTQLVLNAVFIEVDASALPALARDPDVVRIAPVADYELHLGETVPYIGAKKVQRKGFDGSGVRVAVLDSGIDYTHANLGGGGTLADYEAAYGLDTSSVENTSRDGLFPTERVVDGFDFVGEEWPNGPLIPDEDPIDFEGHGTHVADIIGGSGGVAPGVDLLAVKVCSAIGSACSGVALILGMEFAVDPDGDGDPSDAVDIINMSLGANYGQPFDDDLSAAVDNATALGVLTVASAGNAGDKPYISGTPAAAATAISVAQTQVPSARLQFLEVDGTNLPAVFQTFSAALTSVVSGPMQYGELGGGNENGCAPYASDLSGTIALIDRGACNFSLKVKNANDAGAIGAVIGLVAPGAPFAGADGGDGPIDIPGFMISQADSDFIKAQIAAGAGIGTLDPDNGLALVSQMVGSSSRGPRNGDNMLKPEIGAPGASVSAEAGTGSGETPFGGTSGAAPMVAGSAALIMDGFGEYARYQSKRKWRGYNKWKWMKRKHGRHAALSPLEVKSILMNNGRTAIDTDPFTGRAPVSRIGGGEVRVNRALKAPIASWQADGAAGALSFGFVDVADDGVEIRKRMTVRNYRRSAEQYQVGSRFRFKDDKKQGVRMQTPHSVKVRSGRSRNNTTDYHVTLKIDGSDLPGNFMNSGSEGANAAALTANEYDGYLVLKNSEDRIRVPWHVIPRKAARVVPDAHRFDASEAPATIGLDNTGVGTAQIDSYALIAVSEDLPAGAPGSQSPTPDIRALGVNTIPVDAGFCSADPSFLWVFASNTWERQTHLLPLSMIWFLDTNQDGIDDYAVLNRDLSGLNTIDDGRQLSYALNLQTGAAQAFFFAEHATNTGNTALIVCAEQVGLSGADLLTTNVNVSVLAQDFYFGGPGDLIEGLTITPLGERFLGLTTDIPGKAVGQVDVLDFGAFPGNSEELGIMLFTNGDRGAGNRGGATQQTEALLLGVDGADLSAVERDDG